MIELNRRRGHPVYLQIKEQFERRIASGHLSPGDGLPSVRELAGRLSINPNTVVRAYRELEAAGLVETRHGEGSFVAAQARREAPAARLLGERAREFVRSARELGCELDAALRAVERAWGKEKRK